MSQCPGQDGRNLKVSIHKCPNCGHEVEMFSDEQRVKCGKCGKYVSKAQVPSCISYCKSAKDCIGEERWKELVEKKR